MAVGEYFEKKVKSVDILRGVLFASTAIIGLSLPPLSLHAQDLPRGASVQSGNVSIATSGADMTIHQGSQRAIVNWNDFSVGARSSVNFVQPNSSSAILNRVTGSTTSSIAGSITASGQVFLINPNGIAITSSGNIQVGSGFVASTLNITDQNFLSNKLTFEGSGASAKVRNTGVINVGRGGYAALIGGTVQSDGLIAVPYGKVGLGSGEQAVLDFSGDGFLQVAVPTKAGAEGDGALLDHRGNIQAEGGMVIMQAATAREAARNAVNLSGVVEAKSVSGRNGAIVIGGGHGGSVKISGKLNTTSTASRGGKITVTGQNIGLAHASIDASGATGGGTVKIGGDWQGQSGLERAATTAIDKDSIISADATQSGHGGTVVIWSDAQTGFDGLITARGAGLSGNGGSVEVSGQQHLNFTGFVDLTASHGDFGHLLLDPYNVVISNATGSHSSGFIATGDDSIINITTLQSQLNAASVTVSTGTSGNQAGNISLKNALTWSANTTLTLQAAGDISFDAALTATGQSAGLIIQYGAGKDYTIHAPITLSGATATLQIGENGNLQTYKLLHSMADVEAINTLGLSGNYALAQDLTSTTPYTQSLIGKSGEAFFAYSGGFSGIFAGLGNTISNFTINKTSSDINSNAYQYYGLFGFNTGRIRDLGLVGGSISTNHGDYIGAEIYVYAGNLVGYNYSSSISNISTSGSVSISNLTPTSTNTSANAYAYAGGLIGRNSGTITNAYTTGNVSISELTPTATNAGFSAFAGGLIGLNFFGTITNTYATGNVSISELTSTSTNAYAYAGGLIGYNLYGTITNTCATGDVSISNLTATYVRAYAGGLIGYSDGGYITNTYATGDVSISDLTSTSTNAYTYAGGLIGYNLYGTITNGSANGNVTISNLTATDVSAYAGGLAGQNDGTITNAYATGRVLILDLTVTYVSAYAGGLIGSNYGNVSASYFNTVTSGQINAIGIGDINGVTGLTTAQLQSLSSYAGSGWDFETIWAEPSAGYYPYLHSITPVISITIPNQSKNYGQAFDLTAVAHFDSRYVFASSEQLSANLQALLTTDATLTSSIGTYTISMNANSVVSSSGIIYRIANVVQPATLTITPVAISVTANAQSRSYGTANPNLTYQVTSGQLYNGDTLSGLLTTSATSTSNIGSYAITRSNQNYSNYTITFTGANLTITPAAISVTANAQSRSYSAVNPSLTYQVTSGQLYNGDTLSGLLTTSATTASNIGSYAITRSNQNYSNYSITFTGANLTITPAALTATANNASKFYDGLAYSGGNGVRYLGFMNGETTAVLTGSATFGGTAQGAINIGTYSITLSGLSAQNYTISYVAGSLNIAPVFSASPSGHHLTSNIITPSPSANPAQIHWPTGPVAGSGEIFDSLLLSGNACLGPSGWGACGGLN